MEQRSYFRRVLNSVFNGVKRLFGYEDPHSKLSDYRDEGFFKLNVGADFLKQLSERCADSNFVVSEGFKTVIEIPISLGKQLYAACIQSIIEEEEAQSEILAELKNQHEEFENELKNLRNSQEQLNNSYVDLTDFGYRSQSLFAQKEGWVINSVQIYRDQARRHYEKRDRLFKMAQECLKLQDAMAHNYFAQASQHLKAYEKANDMAFKILKENCLRTISKHDCVDLHGFTVKEAISVLNEFLDENIDELIESKWPNVKSVMVITGQGKHSVNGIPKIKPAVCQRLKERDLRYSETNPGLLKIKINLSSNYSADIDVY